MIEAKVEGRNVVATPAAHVAPVIDIMEALKRSLAAKRKPVMAASASAGAESAEQAPKRRARKTAGA
jgi:non-homologous end joining protein Ku